MRVKGTIDPRTITHRMSAQTGRCHDARLPRSETVSPTRPAGKLHHGCTIVQKSVAKRKPHAISDTESRYRTSRSAIRRYAAKITAAMRA